MKMTFINEGENAKMWTNTRIVSWEIYIQLREASFLYLFIY